MSHITETMVLLRDLHLTLTGGGGAVNILRGVDLRVAAGETLSVVGPSGAGKTTLLMVIAGLERASAGLVQVAGHSLGDMDEDALARFRRRWVGIVFQAFHLVPTMTALENVALPLELAGSDSAAERAQRDLAAVGLAERQDHYPGQLSAGEQQRVAIARAFVARPPLLLADEPTGNLDEDTGRRISDLLFDLAAEHRTTMMLITHNRSLARRSGRLVTMRSGRLFDGGSPEGP